jgi:hypothetical protein
LPEEIPETPELPAPTPIVEKITDAALSLNSLSGLTLVVTSSLMFDAAFGPPAFEISDADIPAVEIPWEPPNPPLIVVDATVPARRVREDRIVLPLFVEASKCRSQPCRIGISPEAYSKQLIEDIATSLRACATREQPVVVHVRGFASSSGFAGQSEVESRDSNLNLANERARIVASELNASIRALDANLVSVTAVPWPTFGAMRGARRYMDDHAGYLPARGRFNRRVDLVIETKGACTDLQPASRPI